VGSFANDSASTTAEQDGLFWRVRQDCAEQRGSGTAPLADFDPGQTGTDNQRAVGQALSGGQLGASDDYAAVLSIVAGITARLGVCSTQML